MKKKTLNPHSLKKKRSNHLSTPEHQFLPVSSRSCKKPLIDVEEKMLKKREKEVHLVSVSGAVRTRAVSDTQIGRLLSIFGSVSRTNNLFPFEFFFLQN